MKDVNEAYAPLIISCMSLNTNVIPAGQPGIFLPLNQCSKNVIYSNTLVYHLTLKDNTLKLGMRGHLQPYELNYITGD